MAATMTRWQALLQERADLVAEGERLYAAAESEARDLTEAERARDDQINARLTDLAADLGREEQRRERLRTVGGNGHDGARVDAISGGNHRAAQQPFESLGAQLQAIAYARARGDSASRQRLEMVAAALGVNEAVDSEGGYLLVPEFSAAILQGMQTGGQILSRLNPIEISGNAYYERQVNETSRADGFRGGGVRAYWVEEAGTKTPSAPTFRRIVTEAHKLAALGYATDESLEDIPALTSQFQDDFANELRFKVEDAVFEGDGVGKPLGFASTGNPSLITVAAAGGQAADTLLTENLNAMWARLPVRSMGNAVWFANKMLAGQFDSMYDAVGTGAVQPRFVTYDQQGVLRVKGAPVVYVEYAGALGDLTDIVLADLSQYRFVTKGGIKQDQSIHVQFVTDQTAFRAVWRVGGQPLWPSAVTPFKGSDTESPFIRLAAR